mgnify:CR=1 FL=1
MYITTIQKEILKKYNIPICGEINELLLLIDAKITEIYEGTSEVHKVVITEIGYEANYERVNSAGRELERLYDELYDQN